MKIFLLLLPLLGFSQLHHQTIGVGGGSSNNGVVFSVGQASVVGNHFSQGYSITQGFVQPLKGSYLFESPKDSFQVTVYPNPFVESFKASFKKEFSSITIIIQNTLGQTIYQKGYANSIEIVVEIPDISSQTYLVTIIADDQTFKAKLIQR
tara:strand:- start:198 stop:650 length:453 start_codon:yes stop_codon:yes gene_type:complete